MTGEKTLVLGEKGLKIHALQTGCVAVKSSHKHPSWWEPLRFPTILLDPRWTEWMPIMVWLIDHPEGLIMIDTGETSRVLQPGYFKETGLTGAVSKRILRFSVTPQDEIQMQLAALGYKPDDVRWIILTHMHLDHVDGLEHFPHAEVIVSRREMDTLYGAVPALLPDHYAPRQIEYKDRFGDAFPLGYVLTEAEDVVIVPTHGHSFGHQSVLLRHKEKHYMFAGDASFTEEQLRQEQVAGICADPRGVRESYRSIKAYCQAHPTVYMPSHDPASPTRLLEGTVYTP